MHKIYISFIFLLSCFKYKYISILFKCMAHGNCFFSHVPLYSFKRVLRSLQIFIPQSCVRFIIFLDDVQRKTRSKNIIMFYLKVRYFSMWTIPIYSKISLGKSKLYRRIQKLSCFGIWCVSKLEFVQWNLIRFTSCRSPLNFLELPPSFSRNKFIRYSTPPRVIISTENSWASK